MIAISPTPSLSAKDSTRSKAPRPDTLRSLPVNLETRVVTGTGGGPDKTILNTPRFLDPYGYRTLCAFFHPPQDPGFETLRSKAETAGAPIVSIPDRGPLDPRVVTQLVRLCKSENVAVWHGHDYKSNALGLLVRKFHRMRLITTVHGWALKTSRASLYYRIDRWCLKRYEHVVCVSPDLREECLRVGVKEDRCTLIENGIDLGHYHRKRSIAEAKESLGLPPDRLLVVAVGRLSPEKNFPMLIRSIDRLIRRGLDVGLAIAGEGCQQDKLVQLIRDLNRGDRIQLLGFRSDPRPLYEAADAYALSSDREGLPNVLLEAMALHVPVVATRVAGVPRLIEHDQNGLLIEVQDETALTNSLEKILTNRSLSDSFGQRGRETIENRYSFEVRMKKMATLYESLGISQQIPTLHPALQGERGRG